MTANVIVIVAWTNVLFASSITYGSFYQCPQFPAPKNGQMICDHILGRYCTPSCNPGYVPESRTAWAYFCNPNSGRWATYPEFYSLPWPDCVPEESHRLKSDDTIPVSSPSGNGISSTSDQRTMSASSSSFNSGSSSVTSRSGTDSMSEKLLPLSSPYGQLYMSETVYKSSMAPQTNAAKTSSNTFAGDSRTLVKTTDERASGITPPIKNNKTIQNDTTSTPAITEKNNSSLGNRSFDNVQNKTFSATANTNNNSNSTVGKHTNNGNNVKNSSMLPVSLPSELGRNSSKGVNSSLPLQSDTGRNDSQGVNSSVTLSPPYPPLASDLTAYLSKLLQNNSKELSYQVVEEHKNNRTRTNELDVTTVKNSHYDNNRGNEMDVENITIATTKTDIPLLLSSPVVIPLSSSSLLRNHTMADQIANTTTINAKLIKTEPKINTHDNHVKTPSIHSIQRQQQRAETATSENKNSSKKDIMISGDRKVTRNDQNCGNCNVSVDQSTLNGTGGTLIKILISRKKLNEDLSSTPSENHQVGLTKNDVVMLTNNLLTNGSNGNYNYNVSGALNESKVTAALRNNSLTNDSSFRFTNNNHNMSGLLNESRLVAERPASRSLHNSLDEVDEETQNRLNKIIKAYFKEVKETEIRNGQDHQRNRLPSTPVFSAKDLQLLRKMVEMRRNNKRSDTMGTTSSLWSKMLELTSESSKKSSLSPYTRLASGKSLTERDPKLAQVIMKKVNKVEAYKFQSNKKPLSKSLLSNTSKHAKQGDRRQYVWNGATFVPMDVQAPSSSYLNSFEGLSGNSPYVWNGATFEEAPSHSESGLNSRTSTPFEQIQEQSTIQHPQATEQSNPQSAEQSRTQTTGQAQSTFPIDTQYQVTSTLQAAYEPTQQKNEVANKDVQTVLDIWNKGGESSSQRSTEVVKPPVVTQTDSSSENAIFINGQRYILAPNSTSTANENRNSISNSPPTQQASNEFERDTANNQVLYYWNGESYKTITHGQTLPRDTIKYTYNGASYDMTPESSLIVNNNNNNNSNNNKSATEKPSHPTEESTATVSSSYYDNKNNSPTQSIDSIHSYEEFERAMETARASGNTPAASNNNNNNNNNNDNNDNYQSRQDNSPLQQQQQQSSLSSFHNALQAGEEKSTETNDIYSRKTKPSGADLESILQSHYPSNPYSLTSTALPPFPKKPLSTTDESSWQPVSSSVSTDDKGHLKYKLQSLQSLEKYLSGLKEEIITDTSKHISSIPHAMQIEHPQQTNPFLPSAESSQNVQTEKAFLKPGSEQLGWKITRPLSEDNRNPYLPTEKAFLTPEHDQLGWKTTHPLSENNYNPYLPTEKAILKPESLQLAWKTTHSPLSNRPNPYLPPENKNTVAESGGLQPVDNTQADYSNQQQNPFKDDQDALEAVISNDLNIRKEINSLSTMFGQGESDSQELDKPTDLKLMTSSFYNEPSGSDTSLDQDLENSFTGSIPQRSDMRKPENLEGIRKDKYRTTGGLKVLPTQVDDTKKQVSQELKSQLDNPNPDNKVDLKDLREKQDAFMEILKSLETEVATTSKKKGQSNKQLSQTLRSAYAATLSPSDTLLGDHKTPNILSSSVHTGKNSNTYSRNPFYRSNQSPSSSFPPSPLQSGDANKWLNQPALNKDEIHDLLKITKLAELSAVKKHGLAHPTLAVSKSSSREDVHLRAKTLLKNPRLKRLLEMLVHSKKPNRFLDYLKRSYSEALKRSLTPSKQKLLKLRHSTALKKLFELWEKKEHVPTKRGLSQQQQQQQQVLKTMNVHGYPLPKFG